MILAAIALPLCGKKQTLWLIQWWCKKLLKCFNLRVITFGERPSLHTQKTMFVANHISWSDIHAINSVIPVRFIAKMEIKDWPVFGYLVKKSGTLFINRTQRKDAARIVDMASTCLENNDNVCFFPEGTTTEGHDVLPFKSSIIQAAINANAQVIPIAIRYPLADGSVNTQAAYAGDTTLLHAMQTLLKQKSPVIELHFLTSIDTQIHTQRQHIALQAYTAIKACLQR